MKKVRICCLVLILSFLLAACGKGSAADPDSSADLSQRPEWAYVPERIEINDEKVTYEGMQLVGDRVFYLSLPGLEESMESRRICRYSLTDNELTSTSIEWPMDVKNQYIRKSVFSPDGSLWVIVDDYSLASCFLYQFDQDGKNLVSQDVTEQLGYNAPFKTMAVDGQGRIYVFADEKKGICLYTGDGSYQDSVSYGSLENVQIRGCADGREGKLYVCVSAGTDPDHCILLEVDFEKGLLTELTKEFPKAAGMCADPTGQYSLLWYDNISAYGYDLSTQTAQELFIWSESDINGFFVKNIGVMEDGRYFCGVEDWWYEDRCVVLLTKMKWEETPRKENITLATVGGGKGLTVMAVRFNRGNDQYHLTMKDYDSLTDLYNALLAKESIDLIDLSGVDVEKLSGQGVFTDLTPWLEQSEIFSASDFLDGVLETYTFDDTLVGIPEAFTLQTVVGDRSLLTDGGGMTLDGFLAAAERNPQALPFGEMTKEEIMRYLMMLNEDAFIDWDKGECYFDSEQFKKVLELVSRFPDSIENGPDEPSVPTRIRKGEVLMVFAELWRLDGYQLYEGICGDRAACIGFPTPDGQGGTLLLPHNAYGIVAGSAHKEGAWKFIESVLTRMDINEMEAEEVYNAYLNYDMEVGPNGLPTQRRILDIMTNYKLEADSQKLPQSFPGKTFGDGWRFQYHATTMDDVNVILDLLKEAVPAFSVENDDVLNIINEEAYAYYSGQKGIDEVVSIIQNRIKLYVKENR